MSTWRVNRPSSVDRIKDIPELCQDNFDAIEDIIGVEHQTFTEAASGKHKIAGITKIGTTAEITALSDPPTGAVGFDTTLGVFVYDNGSVWKYFGQDQWSRCRSSCLTAQTISADSAVITAGYDYVDYDTLSEMSTATNTFTVKASGSYVIVASIGLAASAIQVDSITSTATSAILAEWTCAGSAASGSNVLAISDDTNDTYNYASAVDKIDRFTLSTPTIPTGSSGIEVKATITAARAGCTCNNTCYNEGCTCYNVCYVYSCVCNNACYGYTACSCNSTCYGQGKPCTCNSSCYGYTTCSCNNTCYSQSCTCNNTVYNIGQSCTCYGTCYGYVSCSCNSTCYGHVACTCNYICYAYVVCEGCTCDSTCYGGYLACSCNNICYGYVGCSCDNTCYVEGECPTYSACSCNAVCYAEDAAKPGVLLTIGGTQYLGTNKTLSIGWLDYTEIWSTNPSTGLPWTTAGVSGIQDFGYKLLEASATSGVIAAISKLYLEATWFPTRPIVTLGLYKNGSLVEATYVPIHEAGGISYQTVQLCTILQLNPNDTLQVRVSKTMIGDTTIADARYSYFTVHRLGGTCL